MHYHRPAAKVCFFIASFFITSLFFYVPVMAGDMITIGAQEDVLIEPYGIKVPARIDTGATTTSLDARNIKVTGGSVSFNIPDKFGGKRIILPVKAWKYIRTSRTRDRRPVVEMDLCIASKTIHARVNLNDRSGMNYPMIIGRNVLAGNFVVDVSKPQGQASTNCTKEKGP